MIYLYTVLMVLSIYLLISLNAKEIGSKIFLGVSVGFAIAINIVALSPPEDYLNLTLGLSLLFFTLCVINFNHGRGNYIDNVYAYNIGLIISYLIYIVTVTVEYV